MKDVIFSPISVLENSFNSLINDLGSQNKNIELKTMLSTLSERSYFFKNFSSSAIQSLSDIDTLLKSDPITVMASVNDYDFDVETILTFQENARKKIAEFLDGKSTPTFQESILEKPSEVSR